MSRSRTDWRAGAAVAVLAAVAYLSATPSGRARQSALGILPGWPCPETCGPASGWSC